MGGQSFYPVGNSIGLKDYTLGYLKYENPDRD
uniref:Uncharacterized protein n=1 Tax=Anguilla anguilla TaxID=7936 RepID=A0A0E9SH79_ANGAN